MVMVWFMFPETANLSLEEIGKFFGDEVAREDDDIALAQYVEPVHVPQDDAQKK
jgi:hypothetical protein